MKINSLILVFCTLLICLFLPASGWSKQVVTDTETNWAQNVVAQEKSIKSDVIPNSLAVLYFHNQTGWEKLNLLEKGLTLMLITDLSKIPEFQLVERARLQALMDELKFENAEIFSEANRARLGNLLRAEHIVGGDILKNKLNEFKLDSKLLQVVSDKVIASPQAVGELLAGIFKMEKELLFEIIDQMNIALTKEQRVALEKPITNSLTALLLLFEGVELSDKGKHDEAAKLFQQALQADPDLVLAEEFLADIRIYFAMPAAGPKGSPNNQDVKPTGQTDDPNDPTVSKKEHDDDDGDGFSPNQGDLNDKHAGIYPGAPEYCDGLDNNQDGQVDEGLSTDADNDGYFSLESCPTLHPADDCNDGDPNINPSGSEICNNADDNCNGQVDEGLAIDADNDGHFASGSCGQLGDDCNDADQAVNPSALEACNNIDDNCDGLVDEGFDNDGDGFTACTECDDSNADINPNALETCNNVDDNCDGLVDEGLDNDGDGFAACNECDDNNPAVNPAALETCNSIDDNCDGLIDEGFDNDGDGFASCAECDDSNPAINPGALEACNNIDDNCDGLVDEGLDNDGDGYAGCFDCNDADAAVNSGALELCNYIDDNCDGLIDEGFDNDEDGFLVCEGDCNDADASVFPSAMEFCDNIDNNCNGTVDEGVCTDFLTGDHPPIVDPESINQAQQAILVDPALALMVNNGEFRPGFFGGTEGDGYFNWEYEWYNTDGVPVNYLPGLQTIGAADGRVLFMDPATLDRLNSDGFLAYAVQVEEDRLNREILEIHRQETQGALRDLINDALISGDIRTRDDILMQQADAQSGRVLMDQAGNWVRVQQYILRPNDTTIQILNVNLRGAGDHAGLSTMDFTTTLSTPFDMTWDLRMLPWSRWLNTQGPQLPTGQGEADWRYVTSNNNILENMSVHFTAPSGDYLAESRTFAPFTSWSGEDFSGQPITSETLEFSLAGVSGTYDYTTDWQNAGPGEYWVFHDADFEFTPLGNNPSPFYYMHRTGPYSEDPQLDQIAPLVMTEFFAVGDGHIAPTEPGSGNQGVSDNNYSGTGVTDIWDALRVNETSTESEPWISQNNLEITFKQGFSQNASIDLVYIPMSHMLWNPSRTFEF